MSRQVGAAAEGLAARYLEQQQYQILARNFTCGFGELDLIAVRGQELVFVEVRYRRSLAFGGGVASIDYKKRQKLRHLAQYYLDTHAAYLQQVFAGQEYTVRIDILALHGALTAPQVEWVEELFL